MVVTKHQTAEFFSVAAGLQYDDVLTCFTSNPPRMPRCKLAELKVLARFLKEIGGYGIYMQLNKGELEAHLLKVIASMSEAPPNPITSFPSAPAKPTGTSNAYAAPPIIPTSSFATQSTATTTNNKPQNAVSVAPSSSLATKLTAYPSIPLAKPSISVPQPGAFNNASSTSVSNGKYPPNVEARLKELNSKKRRVFDEAVAIPGMTAVEILDALRFVNTADCTVDAVIDKVVMKRSTACDPRDDSNIAALEKSLYDRAVMESEKERDNIQQRKRQKINDLKSDIQSEIFPYENFKQSVLLFGLGSQRSTSSSSSSSSSASTNSASLRGSSLIRCLVFVFDFVASDSRSLELCELISSPLGNLRVNVVEILLMEHDAIKFYKDASHAYLLSLIHKVDAVLNDVALSAPLVDDIFRMDSIKSLTLNQWRSLFNAFNSQSESVRDILVGARDEFQKGMVKIPRDGGLVPEIFRLKSLLPFIKKLSSKVEDDGIELAEEQANLGLLSDRESIPSDDDDFDDDDDY